MYSSVSIIFRWWAGNNHFPLVRGAKVKPAPAMRIGTYLYPADCKSTYFPCNTEPYFPSLTQICGDFPRFAPKNHPYFAYYT